MNPALFSLKATNTLIDTSDIAAMDLLKGAALLYPRLILFAESENCNQISEKIAEGLTKGARKQAFKLFKPITDIDSRWKVGRGSGELLSNFEEWLVKKNNPIDPIFATTLARDWIISEPSQSPDHLFMAFLISFTQNIPYHDTTENLSAFLNKLKNLQPGTSVNTELEVVLPPMASLDWNELFELRKSPYIDSFRQFIHKNTGQPNQELVHQMMDALWTVIGNFKPSPSGSIITRGLGQIPIPFGIPNPLSVYKDIKDGVSERKLFLNYGWLFFMQEANKTKK